VPAAHPLPERFDREIECKTTSRWEDSSQRLSVQLVFVGAAQTLIVTGKRRRAQVDYIALNQELFGGQEEDAAAPDAEYAPSAVRPVTARPASAAGGSPSTSTSPRRLPDAAKTVRAPQAAEGQG